MKILEKLSAKENDLYGKGGAVIAFLGDSVTQGCFECYLTSPTSLETVFDNENAYSMKVKKILHTLYPKAQITIVDSGISGDSAPNGLKRFERDVARYSPDLTVVCFGLNDSTAGLGNLERYAAALDGIFKRLQEIGSEIIFMTPNTMNLQTSPHLTDELFQRLAVSFAKIQNEGVLDAFVARAKEVAKANGVPVCDCYAKWKKMAEYGVNTTELLSNKLNHPTRDMHWLFATSLVETIFEN